MSPASSSASASCARLNNVGLVRLGSAPRGANAPLVRGAVYDLRWRRGRLSADVGPKYGMSNCWGRSLGSGFSFFQTCPDLDLFLSPPHPISDPAPGRSRHPPSVPAHPSPPFQRSLQKKRGGDIQHHPRFFSASPRKRTTHIRNKIGSPPLFQFAIFSHVACPFTFF